MTDATNLKDALVQLRDSVGLSDSDLAEAQRGARDLFVWNIAQDESEIDGWGLLSDQFVQVGEDQQLAIGMWQSAATAALVRIEIRAYRDFDMLATALTARLASTQTGHFIRNDPALWQGLRYLSEPPASLICVLGNLIADLLLIEGSNAELLALSESLIEGLLGESGETAEELNPLTDTSAFESEPVRRVPLAADLPTAPRLDALLAAPEPSSADRPVTRGDRPERIVVSSPSGQLRWSQGRLEGLADMPGRPETTVTLKPYGQKQLRRLRIAPAARRTGQGEPTP